MLLNANQLIDLGIVIPNNLGKKAQVGYDLTLKKVTKIIRGGIYKDRTEIVPYEEVGTDTYIGYHNVEGWSLPVGVYSLTFDQGVNLKENHTGRAFPRSSLLRCGADIKSGVYDPGFKCKEIGATLFVTIPIFIEKGSRIAQFCVWENTPVPQEELYNGQYQAEKDLK